MCCVGREDGMRKDTLFEIGLMQQTQFNEKDSYLFIISSM